MRSHKRNQSIPLPRKPTLHSPPSSSPGSPAHPSPAPHTTTNNTSYPHPSLPPLSSNTMRAFFLLALGVLPLTQAHIAARQPPPTHPSSWSSSWTDGVLNRIRAWMLAPRQPPPTHPDEDATIARNRADSSSSPSWTHTVLASASFSAPPDYTPSSSTDPAATTVWSDGTPHVLTTTASHPEWSTVAPSCARGDCETRFTECRGRETTYVSCSCPGQPTATLACP
ncbi:hypothetical protein F4780DRAFT_594487 [Xylariomycetidae sp. FL0641]|nr:hypothetical protein F4780DRAFT_594487 [Xylariomycetidae sp. FL0641]